MTKFVICFLLSISMYSFALAQTFQTTPLSGANTTGSFYHHTSITLSPGFSTAPGGTFHAYISSGGGCIALGTAPSTNRNFVISYTVKSAGISDPSNTSLTTCQVNPVIQYLDGLGRPQQTIQVKGSPGQKDVVNYAEYDEYGREAKKYLPYAETSSDNGSYKAAALTNLNSFYNSPPTGVVQIPSVSSITPAYAQTVFETSPLNRPLETGAPGAPWQPSASGISGSGHTVRLEYASNDANTAYSSSGYAVRLYTISPTQPLASSSYYAAGELQLTIIKDENWVSTKAGTIEEYKDKDGRLVLRRVFNYNTATSSIETLSTYYVYDDFGNLMWVLTPGANPDAGMPSTPALSDYCYRYIYDHRNRLISRTFPGHKFEEFVYNTADKLVLSRDGNLSSTNKWLFYKYDGFGRQVMTGIMSSSSTQYTLQGIVNSHGTLWESRDDINGSGTGTGYTNASYPTSGIDQYYTINYFDDYSFYGNSFSPAGTPSARLTGLQTGSKVNVLGGSTMLLTTNYYDDYGRVTETKKQNHLSGTDQIVNTWNFAGELTASTRTHVVSSTTTTIVNNWTYDAIGRKLNTMQKMNSDADTHLSATSYNEIGQVSIKSLHNNLQSTSFAYNPRGWLKTGNSTQFAMELKYDDGTSPQYNGNIANQLFTNNASNTFAYTYDAINRLSSGSATGLSEIVTYDINGNIKSLNRNSAGASIYSYFGNHLSSISGGSVNTTLPYVRDYNGNPTTDGRNNKTISYNYLNLPTTVSGGVTYTYDALGTKLKKVNTTTSTTTDYVDGIQYTNGAIDFIQTEEGIARRSGSNYSYEYNLKDHLGNNRVNFDINSGAVRVIQRSDYYPFGLEANSYVSGTKNLYLYNNKELQDELGQYDYGARFYDPVIGRFTTVDPLSEISRRWSPYAYGNDNPVRFVDPDGRFTKDFNALAGMPLVKYQAKDANGANGFVDDIYKIGDKEVARIEKEGDDRTFDVVENNGNWEVTGERVSGDTYQQGSFSDELGQVANLGGVVWGGAEIGLKSIRQNNGPQAIGRYLGFGTQRTANALKGTLNTVSKMGSRLGTAGMVLSAYTYGSDLLTNPGEVKTSTHLNFWISAGLYGTAAVVGGPIVAGAALVYGAGQLGSYMYNGKTLEQNILDR